MTNHDREQSSGRNLAWVVYHSLTSELHATARLEPARQLRKLGWEVTLIAPGRPGGEQSIRGVEVHCVPAPNSYFLGQVVFHLRVLGLLLRRGTSVDLVLCHQLSAPWLLSLKLVRRLGRRKRPLLVVDSRTIPMLVRTSKDRLRAWFFAFGNRLANRWADGQTAITPHMAEAVGIPTEKLWGIWPSGVDVELFAPAQTARRWPKTGESVRLVYTGVLDQVRNLMPMCEAVEKTNAEGMAFTLLLVGQGREWPNLERFALQTEGRVCVRSPVPHNQVPEVLAQAHVGVLPFPDEEKLRVSSFIKLFEYMASGFPILATRIVAHTDVVGSQTYSFWAEDASADGLVAALRSVWDNRASLAEMGREAAKDAHAWTWEEAAIKLDSALEQGLAEHGLLERIVTEHGEAQEESRQPAASAL